MPEPVSVTVWGLLGALSLIDREALREPVVAGVNVTLIVQLAPTATLLPQVLLCAKSPGSDPVKLKLVIVSVEVPLLVRVTFFAALVVPCFCFPKESEVGESLTAA